MAIGEEWYKNGSQEIVTLEFANKYSANQSILPVISDTNRFDKYNGKVKSSSID